MVFSCFGSIAKRLPLCVCGYVLALFSFPLGVPKVPLRTPANDHFLPRLRSDLGCVLLFRIHCQEAAVLLLTNARLRHVFCLGCVTFFVYVRGLFSSPSGAPKVPLRIPANDHFLRRLSSDLGGVLLFRIHPLPIGCRFAFVRARLCHVFCLRTGALFFSFRGSKGATSHPCEGPFFASPELGFRWCLAVSDPSTANRLPFCVCPG